MISAPEKRARAISILLSIIAIQSLGLIALTVAYLQVRAQSQTETQIAQTQTDRSQSISPVRDSEKKEFKVAILEGIPAQAAFPKDTTELPGLMDLLHDPELSPYFLHQIKSQFFGSYLELFQSLNLDSTKSEALRSLLAKRLVSSYEVVNLSRTGSALEVAASLEDNKLRIDSEIHALLGEDAYKSYTAYETGLGVRNSLKQLTRSLAFSNDGLSPQQMNALVSAISSSEPRATGLGNYINPTARTPITIEQIWAHAAAASLTEAQLQHIEAEFSLQDRARQLEMKNSARFQNYLKTWAAQTNGQK